MRHVFVLWTFAAVLIGGARAGQAAITFDYDAICDFQCDNIGLSIGDPVSGWISFSDGAISPGAALGKADVLDFAFDFGAVDITLGTVKAFHFAGVLNGTATAFSSFALRASEGISPDDDESISVNNDRFIAGPGGRCFDTTCDVVSIRFPAFGPSETGFLREIPELREIREPSTLALFGAALAGLGFVRRRAA